MTLDYNKDPSSTYIAIEKLQYFIEKESMEEYVNEFKEKNKKNKKQITILKGKYLSEAKKYSALIK